MYQLSGPTQEQACQSLVWVGHALSVYVEVVLFESFLQLFDINFVNIPGYILPYITSHSVYLLL